MDAICSSPIRPCRGLADAGGELVVGVPNELFALTFEQQGWLRRALDALDQNRALRFVRWIPGGPT